MSYKTFVVKYIVLGWNVIWNVSITEEASEKDYL
jgi:hypothetical protein